VVGLDRAHPTPIPAIPEGDAPLIVLIGPTASGKTALALQWAEALGTEIISADSVQVHIGLDIGSAKPTAAELARVRHHAVSVLPVTERPSAGFWVDHVRPIIDALHRRGRVPIICGGTGLYVRSLIEGLAEIPPIDPTVRGSVLARLVTEGAATLHAELARVDAEAAARIAPSDSQRITRALEVFESTGVSISAWQRATRPPDYQAHVVGLFPERSLLASRIATRAAQMLADGLVAEVEGLLLSFPADAPGLRTLGYREVVSTLVGGLPRADLAERLSTAHRQYAKRQLTWFNKARVDTRVVL
jgi:tRNA dimethylallyltransferase